MRTSTEEDDAVPRRKPKKKQGKREEDLEGVPVIVVEHAMTQEELTALFGAEGWKQLPDEVYRSGFCIGKKNWVMIDTVAGAKSSAIIYSIAETAKANGLKPYDYFKYLLTEIPKHVDDTDRTFIDDLCPWSPNLPANCRKPGRGEEK